MLAGTHAQFGQYVRGQGHSDFPTQISGDKKGGSMAIQLVYEVRIHQQLSHPNVVHLDHWFEDEHNKYIFMEYCSEGVDSLIFRICRRELLPRE